MRSLVVEPPARLRAFEASDWVPLVDPGGYDPEAYRNRGPDGPYGEPLMSLSQWVTQQARSLWWRERVAWCRAHGWPGGLDWVDLFRAEVAARRRPAGGGGPDGQ